ncbi:MAG: hypothetical protein KatS3mg076_0551 [Candidatus Binatia bacterium]|nr:MAG: hypothetical protein KatS3mg076_0551 [Candidatus Binatia bacterium]
MVRSPESKTPARVREGGKRRRRRSSLLNVGRRMDYAVRALCYVAAQTPGRVVPRSEIQQRQQIPQHFLSKILRLLVSGGLLESVSGARGGFRLSRSPEDVTLRAVYECVEGKLCLMECVEEEEAFCCFAPVCTQIAVWRGAQVLLARYLDGITLQDIADGRGLLPRLRQNVEPGSPARWTGQG